MKILIVVGIFPPDIGGPATFVPLIAKKLIENNYKVEIICLSDSLNHKDTDFEFNVYRIKRRQNLIKRWIKTVLKIISVGKRADLIFVNGLPMESYVANLLLRKKVIRKVVGDWAWERGRNLKLTNDAFDEFQNKKHNLHLEIAKFSRGWTTKKADLVITPSEHLKSVVNKWGAESKNIKVIYNGTDLFTEKSKATNKKHINLITVGRLTPFKNIDKIILSLNQLKLLNSNLHRLIIVGDGPERSNLEKLVSENKLSDFVTFTGQLKKSELNKYYQESDIYIQASGYEGLPHTLLEAISHNLSIISTPIGGTNEILENNTNGWTIDLINGKYPDEKDIALKIKYLMENREEDDIKKFKANLLLKEKFNKEENFKEYIKTIENFVNYE
tara:strand:- start:1841 stop:3001 length:1161 start_codon:yes stop_codon:yes gene_type:complete